VASILVLAVLLLNPRPFVGSDPKSKDIFLSLGLCLLPALAAALLCFTRLFWIVALAGMWFLSLGFGQRLSENPDAWSSLLVLGALAMLLAPFVGWVSRQRDCYADKGDFKKG
jgi:hypothetical protein